MRYKLILATMREPFDMSGPGTGSIQVAGSACLEFGQLDAGAFTTGAQTFLCNDAPCFTRLPR